jgi:hypothetical protein
MSKDVPTRPVQIVRKHPIDGQVFKSMIEAGLIWLRTNQQTVNALNVFPVPDGDTGTNMVLTMQAAFDEVANSSEHNVGKLVHGIAHGALMGARGNSGVILSQLWRGFARALDNLETLDAPTLINALHQGRNTAYKGVVRPVEGTILTVAKDMDIAAEKALEETSDVYEILEKILPAADASVQRTPELLSVLREAGVVDSGGKGLYFILEGIVRYINGLPLDTALISVQPLSAMKIENFPDMIEPGQDFEVVVDFHPHAPLDLEKFYADLELMGTSIQVGEGEGIYRMHIHVPTARLYEPIEYTKTLGVVTKAQIENLLAQLEDLEDKTKHPLNLTPVEPGQIAVVAVAPGQGIARVFASLGASGIVEGGQTMNPSTQEILHAFENFPTDNIFILPNNKNIILAAQTAAQLTVKNVTVIPSRTVPQGMAAMLRMVPDGDPPEVAAEMTDALDDVITGEITTATRSVEIDGVKVAEGQIIALLNGKLAVASDDLEDATIQLLSNAQTDQYELITLFYGADVTRKDVNQITDNIRKTFPKQVIEVKEGGQPHYHFIISIE